MSDDDNAIRTEALEQGTRLKAVPLGDVRALMDVCCSSPVPAGWIKVNDHWDPTRCGNPTTIVYNVCSIERYDDKPPGAVMNVCAAAPTPSGWVVVNTFWDPTKCGHPTTISQNMKQIRRVS